MKLGGPAFHTNLVNLFGSAPYLRMLWRAVTPHRRVRPPRHGPYISVSYHRPLVTSSLQTLSDGFLDLAIALPIPTPLPPYSTTIILLTVLTRLTLTLPASLWAKKRQWKAEEVVIPALQEWKPKLQQKVLDEMKKARIYGTKAELKARHAETVKKLFNARRDALYAKHHCAPVPTMLLPAMTQLPIFVATTLVISRATQTPTPLDAESFLTITSLAHADPTLTLPIALGVITLANVESSRWFISEEQRAREMEVQKWREERLAQGHLVVEPKKIVQSCLRVLSVGRIILGGLVPGSVIIFWVTSATFGLFQSWAFDWWERQRQFRQVKLPTTNPPT